MLVRAEFTVEPFKEGDPGPHVQVAVDALRAAGFEVEFGPFGSAISGTGSEVIGAIAEMMRRTVDAGATRISTQVERITVTK